MTATAPRPVPPGLYGLDAPEVDVARRLRAAHAEVDGFCRSCGRAAPCAVARHAAWLIESAQSTSS